MSIGLFVFLTALPLIGSESRAPVGKPTAAGVVILDTQEVDFGDRKIIYNRIEAPELKPEAVKLAPAPVEPVPLTAQEEREMREWEAKRQEGLFLWVTVYDGIFSEVRWWEEGRENVVWSNVNFLHFCVPGELETEEACYQLMISGWEITTAEVRALNATAQSSGDLMTFPPANLPAKSVPMWQAAGPLTEGAKRAMNDLHRHYRRHGAEMAADYAKREEETKAREAWAKAHPPIPQDTVINYFPIRSTAFKATVQAGESGK